MRRTGHGGAVVAVIVVGVMATLALAGCAQSSNTTSHSTGAPGGGAPTATATTTQSTVPTTATAPATATTTTSAPASVPGLTVSPAVGTPRSVIHFALAPTYRRGGQSGDISSALSVTGPQRSGCVAVHNQGLPASAPGQQTTVSLGPAQLGGDWCPGTYSARVVVLERPKCGPGQMCPQFIRVLADIGPVSFRIPG